MSDLYKVERRLGGGYRASQTSWDAEAAEGIVYGGIAVAGGIIGASFRGIGALARMSRDRATEREGEEMMAAAERREFDRVLTLATRFAQRRSKLPDGPMFLSIAYAGKGRYNDAISAIDRAVQLGLGREDAAGIAMVRAGIYSEAGDVSSALKEYSALTQHPELRRDAYMGRSRALIELGDFDQALEDVNRALALAPDGIAYFRRGNIYRGQGQLEKALEDYTRAIRLEPKEPVLYEERAELYEQLGKSDEARADREAAARGAAVNQELREAREFLSYLRGAGVKVEIARNGRDLQLGGTALKRETKDKLQRLKPQLLRVLAGA